MKRNNLLKKKNITNENFKIPNYNDYEYFDNNIYNSIFLKEICKFYKLKVSGNKSLLKERIYNYLYESYFSIKIQKNIKRYLTKKYFKINEIFKRKLCKNDTDFFTLENIKDISIYNFFTIKSKDNSIWGFNIISIYNLFIKSNNNEVLNPYTREKIEPKNIIFNNIKSIIRMSKLFNNQINTKINDENINDSKKVIEIKSLELFQIIDSYGNYTDISWFRTLNRVSLIKFINELYDIWNYRSQISEKIKKEICYPHGNPFNNCNRILLNRINFISLQKTALFIIEQFITKGVNRDMTSLGINYILCAFTLVNQNAANALPWFYESVSF